MGDFPRGTQCQPELSRPPGRGTDEEEQGAERPSRETACVLLRHSLDSPLRASTPGRVPQAGSVPKRARGPSQPRGPAHCGCLVAGARAQCRSRYACAHVSRSVGPPPKSSTGRPPGVAREIRLRTGRHPRRGVAGKPALRGTGEQRGRTPTPCLSLGVDGSGRSVPVDPGVGAQTRRPRQSRGRTARGKVGGGVCAQRQAGGLGVKALEPHRRCGRYQKPPGLGCPTLCCCRRCPTVPPIDRSL